VTGFPAPCDSGWLSCSLGSSNSDRALSFPRRVARGPDARDADAEDSSVDAKYILSVVTARSVEKDGVTALRSIFYSCQQDH
jgi:hypothetical protein